MNEESVKLAKVRKSCRTGKIVTRVLMIIGIVAVGLSLIGGIAFLTLGEKFDRFVLSGGEEGQISESISISTFPSGNGVVLRIDDPEEIGNIMSNPVFTSASKVLDTVLSPSTIFGIYMFFISLMCLGMTLIMYFLTSTFAIIEKEESPFSKKVINRLTAVFIVISAVMLFTIGWGAALIMAITTWALYTIFDYGRILQIQADETL